MCIVKHVSIDVLPHSKETYPDDIFWFQRDCMALKKNVPCRFSTGNTRSKNCTAIEVVKSTRKKQHIIKLGSLNLDI